MNRFQEKPELGYFFTQIDVVNLITLITQGTTITIPIHADTKLTIGYAGNFYTERWELKIMSCGHMHWIEVESHTGLNETSISIILMSLFDKIDTGWKETVDRYDRHNLT